MAIVIYGITLRLLRSQDQRCPASLPGRWRVAHYDADGETHVVLHRISASGSKVLDEHAVAALRSDDAEYDEKFLATEARSSSSGAGLCRPSDTGKRPSPAECG